MKFYLNYLLLFGLFSQASLAEPGSTFECINDSHRFIFGNRAVGLRAWNPLDFHVDAFSFNAHGDVALKEKCTPVKVAESDPDFNELLGYAKQTCKNGLGSLSVAKKSSSILMLRCQGFTGSDAIILVQDRRTRAFFSFEEAICKKRGPILF